MRFIEIDQDLFALLSEATRKLGTDAVVRWLQRPAHELQGHVPMDVLASGGTRRVTRALQSRLTRDVN